jgi:hypothetical protein
VRNVEHLRYHRISVAVIHDDPAEFFLVVQ